MKKRYILLPLLCGFIYLTTTSELPGSKLGTTVATCGQAGCHSGGSGITSVTSLALLDQATSQPITDGKYVPGHLYTVTFKGSNSASMARFGFQLRANKGVYSNAGAGEVIVGNIMLTHGSTSIAGIGGVYIATATWTAPTTGNGAVTFQGVFNAVNGNNSSSGDMPGSSQTFTFNEGTSGVGIHPFSFGEISLYPNPANEVINIDLKDAISGNYTFAVYNALGSIVLQQRFIAGPSDNHLVLNTSPLAGGSYFIQISNESGRILKSFVKN